MPSEFPKKKYLGDGVHAEHNGRTLTLHLGNGAHTIHLRNATLGALDTFRVECITAKAGERDKKRKKAG